VAELADQLATTWLMEQCREVYEVAKVKRDCFLGNHALLTMAKLGGIIAAAPLPALLLRTYSWMVRVQANEAAANSRKAGRLRRCDARRKYDGQPCAAKPLVNGRCKYHGGMSTGPRTPEGRSRALANLRQNRISEPHDARARQDGGGKNVEMRNW
jgi:hypothetical protein